MNFDVNGYDTRGTDSMNVYLPKLKKDIYKNSFLYKGGQVWNCLPDRKWQDYVYIQCEYKSTKQKIKHLLREENKVKENKIS